MGLAGWASGPATAGRRSPPFLTNAKNQHPHRNSSTAISPVPQAMITWSMSYPRGRAAIPHSLCAKRASFSPALRLAGFPITWVNE